MTRKSWKAYYRLIRIFHREVQKASLDMLIYGTGAVEISDEIPDITRYVPLEEIIARKGTTP